jgi:hypothetical protein
MQVFRWMAFLLVLAAFSTNALALQTKGAVGRVRKNSPKVARIYVSKLGNDAWTGRLSRPNASRTDGPFATLHRAQQAARELRKRGLAVEVVVRGGTYFLEKPLVFSPEDSGTSEAPVVYTAYGREKPIISGGVRLTGWRVDSSGRWVLNIPEVARGQWTFTQLFVNGQRRYRPRLPKKGYYFIAGEVPPTDRAAGQGFDRFRFEPGQISAGWHNLQDVEVLPFHIWTMSRFRIDSVDEKEHIVTFTGRTRSTQWYTALPKGGRFLVENVREALSEPGEWYLDRKSGELTYIPKPGEDSSRSVVIAPRLERLVEIKGDVANRRWVEHVVFRGLTFAHTNWVTPPEGNSFPQAEVNLDGAITAVGARNCVLERCTITHIGNYAIELGEGCRNNRIESCDLTDMGGGGVKIGLMGIPADEEAVASHNTVRDCLIAHGGRMHPAAVGVWIGHSHDNRVQHNEIFDFYYTGVSVGWSWGYGRSLAHHNLIEYNHIHEIGQGVLSDMGGIYTLGVSPGTVLRFNHIHDVGSFDYGGWGIYPDEGSTDILIENNLVYRLKSAGFHQHYGRNNMVRNNIFALGREFQIMRSRAEEHLSFTFTNNIVYWKQGELLGSNWSGSNYKLDYNLYWNAAGRPFNFAGMTLEQWREHGQDVHSIIADPMFVDPDRGDFRLKPGSPAEKIGFKPFDISKSGLLTDAAKRKPSRKAPEAFPTRKAS